MADMVISEDSPESHDKQMALISEKGEVEYEADESGVRNIGVLKMWVNAKRHSLLEWGGFRLKWR